MQIGTTNEKGNRNGRKSEGRLAGLAKNGSSKSIKPDKASMLTCLRCRVSGANAAPLKLIRQNYGCAAAPLSVAM